MEDTKFDQFRDACLAYDEECGHYRMDEIFIANFRCDPNDMDISLSDFTKICIERVEKQRLVLRRLTKALSYQLYDTFADSKQKSAYLKSVKYFVETKIAKTKAIYERLERTPLAWKSLEFQFGMLCCLHLIRGVVKEIEGERENGPLQNRDTIPTYTDLDDLFINPESALLCYDALKDVGLIGERFNYIGKKKGSKGAFCVLKTILDSKSLIRFCDEEVFVKLLKKKFKNLSISIALFRKPHPVADEKYKGDLVYLLSPSSQKRI